MYQEKVKFVGENLEKLQGTIERKQDNLRVVAEVLQVVGARFMAWCCSVPLTNSVAFVSPPSRKHHRQHKLVSRLAIRRCHTCACEITQAHS